MAKKPSRRPPRKQTNYKHPSIADQIAAGKGTPTQILEIFDKMVRDGATRKTLKLMKKAAMVHSIDLILP